jgi:nucleotide-binding universal stress UspA family protein
VGAPAVMVAYDGSSAARRALVHAADLVGRSGTVAVVNVIRAQSVSARLETVSDAQRRRQRELLDEARSLLASHGVHSNLVAACGNPYTEILEAAERHGSQILVVGRGRRWRHVLGGSLAIRLASRAHRDVLVVA